MPYPLPHIDFFWHPLMRGHPPPWANEWAQDRRGIYVGIKIQGIQQKLRWIPSGVFMMGSPESEAGRFDNETQHEVTLTQGFWLFDTPVTQALWEAIMGDNPSRFKSPTRPVEQVSWHDCQDFLKKLQQQTGLPFSLPTEAQWEFACRAGTTTAVHAGDLEILGERNAPILDRIAWYGGNSGVGFELDNGFDSSNWPNKQYPHEKAGTRPVATKKPNPWGLYDMLGNVYEWCEDGYGDYPNESQTNPIGATESDSKVLRGGSWFNVARLVRSAYRRISVPGLRLDDVGFRCVLVQ